MSISLTKLKLVTSIKIDLFICTIISLISLVNVGFFTNFGYLIYNDNAPPLYHLIDAYRSLFIWSNIQYSGVPSVASSIPYIIIFRLFGHLVTMLSNAAMGQVFVLWFVFSIGGIGTFFLVRELTNSIGRWQSYLGSFISALLFSLPLIRYNIMIPALFLPLSLFLIIKCIKAVEMKDNNILLYVFLSILSISTLFSISGASFIIQNTLIFCVVAIIFTATSGKGTKASIVKYLSAIFLLSLMINVSWIVNPAFFTKTQYTNFFNSPIGTFDVPSTLILENLVLFTPFPIYELSVAGIISVCLIFIISMLALLKVIRSYNLTGRFMLGMAISYLLLSGLGSLYGKPFNPILSTMIHIFPYINFIATPSTSISYVITLFFDILFGIGIATILSFSSIKKSKIITLICLVGLAFLIMSFLYTDYFNSQLYNTRYLTIYKYNSIPPYVFNASSYMNAQNGAFAIATLPSVNNWQTTTWYTGVNIYSDFIYEHPVYTGGETFYDYLIYPYSSTEYAGNVGIPISDGNLTNASTASKYFGIFGIKYILLQTDAVQDTDCWCSGHYIFDMNSIENVLNQSAYFSFDKKFRNLTIYENKNYVPLIYAANIYDAGNATANGILTLIGNKTFNIQDSVVYSSYFNYSSSNLNQSNVINIRKFDPPKITFVEDSPVSVNINISNATTPYYLVFRNTYNSGWIASYSNGTTINSSNHVLVNGFANAWYISKLGNYSVALYYSPQTIVWAAWSISIMGICTAFYLLYVWYAHGRMLGARKPRISKR